MLIDFRELFPKYNIRPTGVLHIGSNVGEERDIYRQLGVEKQIWIEANTEIYKKLKENVSDNKNAICVNCCIGDENKKVMFHVSNNGSQSSSILQLGTHKDVHPEVHFVEDIEMQMERIDEIFNQYGIFNGGELIICKKEDYDFLNIDLQGAELKALKGMGDILHQFKWAYLEVNQKHLYEGCALIGEIDEYMEKFGFERVETMWCGNTFWGDALYAKTITDVD